MLKSTQKNSSERISVEQYNEEIDISIIQIKQGKTYKHEQMAERIKQWKK